MPQTAAQVLVETLRRHGVDRAFCVPGESYLAVMDALVDDPAMEIVSCRHQGGAAFMAMATDGPVVIEVRTSLELNTSQTTLSALQGKG